MLLTIHFYYNCIQAILYILVPPYLLIISFLRYCAYTNHVCKIWGFYGGDYEECPLLGYKNPVPTSQETHYVCATESSRLILCKLWGFHVGDNEEYLLLGCDILWLAILFILMMEAIPSCVTSVPTRATRGHTPEEGIPHNSDLFIFPTEHNYCLLKACPTWTRMIYDVTGGHRGTSVLAGPAQRTQEVDFGAPTRVLLPLRTPWGYCRARGNKWVMCHFL
jgi:hypothetical protein